MSKNSTSGGSKVKGLLREIKTHWNTPAPGKYVPYKEYKDVVISVGSNYAAMKTMEYIVFAASCYLIMYHYKLPYLTFSVINIINMPLGYIWTLIWWFVCDNLGFLPKKTERKLNLLYICMTLVGLAMIIFDPSKLFDQSGKFVTFMNSLEGISCASAFKILGTHIFYNGYVGLRNIFWRKKLIPKFGRYKYSLYCDAVPKCIMVILIGWLPFYNIPDVVTRVWVANLMFALFNMFGFPINTPAQMETVAMNISPNVRERILVRSYPIKISHIFNSILGLVLPIIIGTLRYKWADINVFRYVIPITFVTAVVLTMIFAGRVKERIPQPPLEKKVQIKFWDGMFGVMSNKYKWINTIVGLFDSLGNGMLDIAVILYLYTFRLSGLIYSLIIIFVQFAGTPPDLLSPYFLKRFSYKQLQIFYLLTRAIGNSIIVLAIWFCGEHLMLCGTICVVTMALMEMCKTVPITAQRDMDVRINDYQMYLSGERLENFSGVFGWFTGPITSFIGLIIPLLLLRFGFNSNWDVLFLDSARSKIIVVPIIIDIIGYLLMTIPYFFWDYTDDKQFKVMEVLRRREEVTRKQMEHEQLSNTAGTAEAAAVAEDNTSISQEVLS